MNTLTLTADEVDLIVRAVVPAASTDDTLIPTLQCIQISVSGGVLWAVATDRYKLCRARLREVTEDVGEALVPAGWFKAATTMLRLHDRRTIYVKRRAGRVRPADGSPQGVQKTDLEVTISWDAESLTFHATGVPKARALATGSGPISMEFKRDGTPAEFPKIAHLFDVSKAVGEFGASGSTMPPASLIQSTYNGGGGVFVPPTADRKTFAVVDPEGKWTWVGMPLSRIARPEPKATTESEEVPA